MPVEYRKLFQKFDRRYGVTSTVLPEFFAIKNNLKPLSAHIIPAQVPEIYRNMERFCKKHGLKIGHSDFKLFFDHEKQEHRKIPFSSPIKGGDIFAFISKSGSIINEAIEDGLEFEQRADYYLGYPDCCVKTYEKVGEDQNLRFTVPLSANKNRSYLLNNFLHWEGPYYLISHFPCSYTCKRSMEYAKELLECIRSEDRILHDEIFYMLTRPVLYNGFKSHARFNGGMMDDGLFHYDTVYGHKYPRKEMSFFETDEILDMHNKVLDLTSIGDAIDIKNFSVFSTGNEIGTLPTTDDSEMVFWSR